MADRIEHEAMHELLGAYALDATEPAESARIEAHLATCSTCRDEVDQLREVAGLLGADGVEPPPHVWEGILTQLGSEPPAAIDTLRVARRQQRQQRLTPWLAAAAVVLLVAIGALGLVARDQRSQLSAAKQKLDNLESGRSMRAVAERAATSPGARSVALRDADGNAVASVVLLSDGTAYLVPTTSMAVLGKGQTYQLWGVAGTEVISLGIMGADPEVERLRVPDGTTALAVTAEASPGVVSSAQEPVAQATVA